MKRHADCRNGLTTTTVVKPIDSSQEQEDLGYFADLRDERTIQRACAGPEGQAMQIVRIPPKGINKVFRR